MSVEIREAGPGDAEAVAAIHEEAVLAGSATLRTEPRAVDEVERVIARDRPFLVALDGRRVVGWASAGAYEESNPYYEGVREVAVYVASDSRRLGAGRALLDALAREAKAAGAFKLVAKVFTTNQASLELFDRCGYLVVGTHVRHGRLRGEWKDVVVLERSLEP